MTQPKPTSVKKPQTPAAQPVETANASRRELLPEPHPLAEPLVLEFEPEPLTDINFGF